MVHGVELISSASRAGEASPATILVVDDDAQVRRFIRTVLEGAGYVVAEAGAADEGLQLHQRAPASLVIADLLMPEKDGLELILELGREVPAVSILAITGGVGGWDFLEVAKLFGAARTLAKPIEATRLLEAVREMTSGGR